jgi:hypothetical protein
MNVIKIANRGIFYLNALANNYVVERAETIPKTRAGQTTQAIVTTAFLVVSVTLRAIGCPLFVIWAMRVTKIGRYIWARMAEGYRIMFH